MNEPYDVAIVGYGPVGQTLAVLLGQRGWRVGVFDSYASERIPQVRQVIELSIQLGKVVCVSDPEQAAARDGAMIAAARETGLSPPLPMPPIGPGLVADGDPLAGRLFPQGEVRRGDTIGRFDDVVGRGFTLLGGAGDPASVLPPDLAAFFASLGGISAHVAPGGPVHDLNGTYARWFAEHGVGVVLQRPDFYVFGTARSLEATAGLVGRLRHALAGGSTS